MRYSGGIILQFFSENKARKEKHEVIIKCNKNFVANVKVLVLSNIKRQFTPKCVIKVSSGYSLPMFK